MVRYNMKWQKRRNHFQNPLYVRLSEVRRWGVFTKSRSFIIPPQTKFWGVYSDPYVRPFVRSSVRPSQSLIRYSCETAEQNFMKLSGSVHYMMPYWTNYTKILLEWFWGFPEQNKNFAIQNMGERWVSFCEHCLQYF